MKLLEEQESRGYYDVDGTVCSECIEEPALQAVIRAEGFADPCDYCETTPQAPEASVDLERIVQLVTDGLRYEYEDPTGPAGWNSQEGGFLVATWETEALLWEHGVTGNYKLVNEIGAAIVLDLWCKYDPYADSGAQALKSGWSSFREYVMHERRYTFLARDYVPRFGNELSMDQVPGAIVAALEEADRIVVFPDGAKWWRARVHQKPGETHSSPSEMGTPPDVFARDNRMSPKGIGAFYGASTEAGALAEVAGYADADQDATVGCFTHIYGVKLVDLRDPPEVPSLFDADRRHLRDPIIFIQSFIEDVTAVAAPDEDQVLEYIPTQVIAEHLHYDLGVNGIVWRSTKDPEVTACVLFIPNTAMTNLDDPIVENITPQLALDPASVKFVPAPLG